MRFIAITILFLQYLLAPPVNSMIQTHIDEHHADHNTSHSHHHLTEISHHDHDHDDEPHKKQEEAHTHELISLEQLLVPKNISPNFELNFDIPKLAQSLMKVPVIQVTKTFNYNYKNKAPPPPDRFRNLPLLN